MSNPRRDRDPESHSSTDEEEQNPELRRRGNRPGAGADTPAGPFPQSSMAAAERGREEQDRLHDSVASRDIDEVILDLLTNSHRIAMVGASADPQRESYRVMRFLLEHGYEVMPVNPNAGTDTIHGKQVYTRLAEVPGDIDIVDVFRNSEAAGEICDEAITAGAKAVWMQLGVINEEGKQRAEAAGLTVIMDRCPSREIPRLGIPGPGS